MSIQFTCPNCGKQTVVADQFAGQTGPCSGCGKPVSIPYGVSGSAYAAPPKSGGGGSLVVILIAVTVGAFFLCGIAVALLLPAVQAGREAARRSHSTNNMKQILIAMHNYHDTYQTLPPAVVTDANGTPLYSGRVLLLPYLEQQALFAQFDKTKAWDSPENIRLSETAIKCFHDPSNNDPNPFRTDYVFVSGPGTAFDGSKSIRFGDVTDGLSNTLGFVETKNGPKSWAEPKDWDASTGAIPPGSHPGGNIGGILDGSVRFMSKSIDPQTTRSLTTRSGGEVINNY